MTDRRSDALNFAGFSEVGLPDEHTSESGLPKIKAPRREVETNRDSSTESGWQPLFYVVTGTILLIMFFT